MRERGWSFRFEHNVAGKYSRPGMITDPKAVFEGEERIGVGIDKEECRAIAIAAAKALGVWVEENT